MAALVQTIAVVDKSGKAVSTSKHLINVFKEAKTAYRERKAEIVAGRQIELEEKKARRALKAYTIDDDYHSTTSSRRSSHSKHTRNRPALDRTHTAPSTRGPTSPRSPTSPLRHSYDPEHASFASAQLSPRHTDHSYLSPRPSPSRAMTAPLSPPLAHARPTSDIDMDLAYGPIPPPLPLTRHPDEDVELKGLINKVKALLEEADCIQHSAAATIANLQKNPDAMAAVALTLAEISNIVAKMAPGALLAMKGSAPAVFALLASPQFLIAGGVAVGVTVVCLGGYKIIKKIKAKNSAKQLEGEEAMMDEMLEIGGDVSRIDNWRRGIAEVEAQSVGTSVDGEFITPQAAALSRLNLAETEALAEGVKVGKKSSRGEKSRKAKTGKEGSSKGSSKKGSEGPSEKSEKSQKKRKEKEKEKKGKEKKPSPLRLMFS